MANKSFDYALYLAHVMAFSRIVPLCGKVQSSSKYNPPSNIMPCGVYEHLEYLLNYLFEYGTTNKTK